MDQLPITITAVEGLKIVGDDLSKEHERWEGKEAIARSRIAELEAELSTLQKSLIDISIQKEYVELLFLRYKGWYKTAMESVAPKT